MKKIYAFRFVMSLVVVATAAGLFSAPAAVAGEMKSDPDNYYLDPEEIRPIIRDRLEFHLDGWTNPDHSFTPLKEFDLRLVDGQIPLYTVEGDLAAYLYIAYLDQGPLPTKDDIMENTREVLEIDREEGEASRAGKTYDTEQMLLKRYPYALKCVYAAVGINDKWPNDRFGAGVPGILINYPVALDGARDYFGTEDVDFVRYIYCSRLIGYEFSNGAHNIIIPFDLGIVESKKVMTREEVDKDIGDYAFTPTDRQISWYFEHWSYRIREYKRGRDSLMYDGTKHEVHGYSNNHYLPQREYDFAYSWYDAWDDNNNCPDLHPGAEGQHSMLGKCWSISFTSCLIYIDKTRYPDGGYGPLRKINNNGMAGRDVYNYAGTATDKKYPPTLTHKHSTEIISGTVIHFSSAYFAHIMGACYQNFPTTNIGGEEKVKWYEEATFFWRGQDSQNHGLAMPTTAHDVMYAETLRDFGALSGSGYQLNRSNKIAANDFICIKASIDNHCPFVSYRPGHCCAVYGYETLNGDLYGLGYFDWTHQSWPGSTAPLLWDSASNFYDQEYLWPQGEEWTVTGFVAGLKKTTESGSAEVRWRCTANGEKDVLGFNVVSGEKPYPTLNDELIRTRGRLSDEDYTYRLPEGFAGDVYLELVFKDGMKSLCYAEAY